MSRLPASITSADALRRLMQKTATHPVTVAAISKKDGLFRANLHESDLPEVRRALDGAGVPIMVRPGKGPTLRIELDVQLKEGGAQGVEP